MCYEKHCIHERIVISFFMLTVFEKAPKIKCLPTKFTQKFSNLMIFILMNLQKLPKVTKIISTLTKLATSIWYVTLCSLKGKKNMSHIVPFCRSHSSKAQYWQCGCIGDNSLYMVRGCIISFIVSLRRWIFKVFGNTFVSSCNVHGEGVLFFKNVSVYYHNCKQYFFQLFIYMYSEVSNMINKLNNTENTMQFCKQLMV